MATSFRREPPELWSVDCHLVQRRVSGTADPGVGYRCFSRKVTYVYPSASQSPKTKDPRLGEILHSGYYRMVHTHIMTVRVVLSYP